MRAGDLQLLQETMTIGAARHIERRVTLLQTRETERQRERDKEENQTCFEDCYLISAEEIGPCLEQRRDNPHLLATRGTVQRSVSTLKTIPVST
jgi:hypothetical protein